MYRKKTITKAQEYLIYFFPIALVIGNFFLNLTVILLSLIGLTISVNKKKLDLYFNKVEIFLFMLFLFILLVSIILNSENLIYSFRAFTKIIISFFFSLSIANYFLNYETIKKYLKFLSLLIIFISIDGWIQFFTGENLFGYKAFTGHGVRLTGFFGDEAILGSYLSKFFIMGIFYFFFIKKNYFIAIIASFFLVLSVLITNERMAFILTFFGFMNFFFYYIFISKNYKQLLFFPILVFVVILFISTNKNIYDQLILKTDKYFGGITKPLNIIDTPHGVHWLTAYKIFKDNTLIGSGLKNFRIKCSYIEYSTDNKFNDVRCSTHPHNMVFEFLSETGLFGTITFSTFIILLLFKNFNLFKNPYFFSISLSIILYLWPISTSGSFFSSWNGSFFWFYLGLLISIGKISRLEKL